MKSRRLTFLIAMAAAIVVALTGFAAAQNPVPLINQPLVPDVAKPGGAAFTLTVNGTGFVSSSVVKWNGHSRITTFVNSSRLTASILSSDVAKAGTAAVTVANSSPGGGASNAIFFEVTPSSSSIGLAGTAFAAGISPSSAAVGDFNRDGKLDLAVANLVSNNISILLGKGDGTFLSAVNYGVGSSPTSVATADFNGDGKLDLVTSNAGGDVSVLLGNGDGTFRAAVNYSAGANPNSVTVGDFNRDGNMDLAVANGNSNNVSVLLGNGDGTFQVAVTYDAGAQQPMSIAVGDFNNDGKLDLVVTNYSGANVSVLLGNGDGTFLAPANYGVGSGPNSVVVADFNGDGKLDLAVANTIDFTVSVLLGKGDGTFYAAVNYGTGQGPRSVAVADLNGDGKLDLVTANNPDDDASVLFGNGDGTFRVHSDYAGINQPESVALGDFNGDGRIDIVAPLLLDQVGILLQVPVVTVLPTGLTFQDQVIGTASASKNLTLTNASVLGLSITSIAVTGTNANDFVQTNTCGLRLAAGAKCVIKVIFTPTHIGQQTASVTITDNAAGSPQEVALSGTGVVSGPNATLSPITLMFTTTLVATTSPVQSVTLSDYGTAMLGITGISFTGANASDFQQTNTCGMSLVPGASCTINVTFKPTQRGLRTATLSITDNASGNPQKVSLTGTGTVVVLNPTDLGFGTVHVHTSKTESATLTNIGSTTLSITGILVTGKDHDEFSQVNTCGSSVGAGQSCTITVTFTPSEQGGDSADVSIGDNGGGSPQQVPLSGKGGIPAAARLAIAAHSTAAVPGPTGSSHVGTRVMDLVDTTRDDPFLVNGTKRELLIRFWYPASLTQGCNPAEYTSPTVWSYFSQLAAIPLPEVTTNSCLEAPIAGGAHPVVVFTHGYTGTFTDYTFLFEDLASRGYVVASIDHTYEATAVEFPNGRLVKSVAGSHLANTWRTDEQSLFFALSVRLDDLKFILNELERLNRSADKPFAGKLDLTRVALAGHSLGGLTAWLGVQREKRFKAAVLMDPYLADIGSEPTETPVLLMAMGREKPSQDECRLWSDLHGPRFLVNLRGAEHVTPSDAVWLAKGAIRTGATGPEKTIDALRRYIAAFLDSTLRSEASDVLLEGSSSEFPGIVVTTQNQPVCRQP